MIGLPHFPRSAVIDSPRSPPRGQVCPHADRSAPTRTGLSRLSGLLTRDARRNALEDIEALRGTTGLVTLHLDGNALQDIAALSLEAMAGPWA